MSLYFQENLVGFATTIQLSDFSDPLHKMESNIVKSVDGEHPDSTGNAVVTLSSIVKQNNYTGCYANLPNNDNIEIRRGSTETDAAIVLGGTSKNGNTELKSGTIGEKQTVLTVSPNGLLTTTNSNQSLNVLKIAKDKPGKASFEAIQLNNEYAPNLIYISNWSSVNTVTISFDTAGGNSISPMKFAAGVRTAGLPVPERNGYTFLYWKNSAGDIVYHGPFSSDTSLTAVWQSSSGGGSGGINSEYDVVKELRGYAMILDNGITADTVRSFLVDGMQFSIPTVNAAAWQKPADIGATSLVDIYFCNRESIGIEFSGYHTLIGCGFQDWNGTYTSDAVKSTNGLFNVIQTGVAWSLKNSVNPGEDLRITTFCFPNVINVAAAICVSQVLWPNSFFRIVWHKNIKI